MLNNQLTPLLVLLKLYLDFIQNYKNSNWILRFILIDLWDTKCTNHLKDQTWKFVLVFIYIYISTEKSFNLQKCIWVAFVHVLCMQTGTQKLGNTKGPLRNICPVNINHQKYDQHPHDVKHNLNHTCFFFNMFNSFVLEQEFTVPYKPTYKPLCAFVWVISGRLCVCVGEKKASSGSRLQHLIY